MTSKTTAKTPVIVYNGWGNFHVYPATLERAKAFLEDHKDNFRETQALMEKLRKSNKEPDGTNMAYVVSDDVVLRAFKDLLTLKEGDPSRALYRLMHTGVIEKGVTVPVLKNHQNELVLWAFENGYDLKEGSGYARLLEKLRPEKSLSFMAGLVQRAKGRPIEYIAADELDQAEELGLLLHGTWKPTAKIENIVQRYLTFLNQFSHRDERYEIGWFEGEFVAVTSV